PIYFGQYLHAIVLSLKRSLDLLYEFEAELDLCPLGAGSIAGTNLPIMPSSSARLLGFRGCLRSSIDAVAGREVFLRLLAELSVVATSLSRVSADLQLWTTKEFGLFDVDDCAAGGSSMMPQKKNIYFLEHVKGKSASLIGRLAGALTAVHATPFTNSIAVGTEAMKNVEPAIDDLIGSVTLLRIVLEHSVANEARSRQILASGFTNATALAEAFVNQGLYTFRQAHNRVGEIVRKAIESGKTSLAQAIESGMLNEDEGPVGQAFTDLVAFRPAQHGLVLSGRLLDEEFRELRGGLREHYLCLRANRQRRREAALTLERTATAIAQQVL
ncbi:MAG: lyase family protein, partial [Nitratireductor sp.]